MPKKFFLALLIFYVHTQSFAEANKASTFPRKLDKYKQLHTQMTQHFQNVIDLQKGLPISEIDSTRSVLNFALGMELTISNLFDLYFLEQQMLNKADSKEIRKVIVQRKEMLGKMCDQSISGITTQVAGTSRAVVASEFEKTRDSIVEICDFFNHWD